MGAERIHVQISLRTNLTGLIIPIKKLIAASCEWLGAVRCCCCAYCVPVCVGMASSARARARARPVDGAPPVAVELNVYDLNVQIPEWAVSSMYMMGVGLYHSGVSIFGTEYCFGGHPDDSTGVFEVSPRTAPEAKFRESIIVRFVLAWCTAPNLSLTAHVIGRVHLPFSYRCRPPRQPDGFQHHVARLQLQPAHKVSRSRACARAGVSAPALSTTTDPPPCTRNRNCNHFASELCEKLCGNAAPGWINRLAWMGEKAKFLLPEGVDKPMMAPVQAQHVREAQMQRRPRRSEEADPDASD